MPDLHITARHVMNATVGEAEDAPLRLDAGRITLAPRGIFGMIVHFIAKITNSDHVGTKKLLSGLNDDFRWRYGSEIGPEALKLARAAHDASDDTTPLTRGQLHTAEVFARALTKNNERHEVADTAMRYAPGALGFAKVAREADVNPNSLSAIQKQHYTELLRYQVGMAAGGPVVNRKAQLDIAIGTLRHVARMDAAEIEASNKWLTDVRDAGIKLARDIAEGGKPEQLASSLRKFQELATERPHDIGLLGPEEVHPGEKNEWVGIAVGVAISSAVSALPVQEARDLYKDAMAEKGSGRMVVFATARDMADKAPPLSATGETLRHFPSANASKQLHNTNKALLNALAERGAIETAEREIEVVEQSGKAIRADAVSSAVPRAAQQFIDALSSASEKRERQPHTPATGNKGKTPISSPSEIAARRSAPAPVASGAAKALREQRSQASEFQASSSGKSITRPRTPLGSNVYKGTSVDKKEAERERSRPQFTAIMAEFYSYTASEAFSDKLYAKLSLHDRDKQAVTLAMGRIHTMVTAAFESVLIGRPSLKGGLTPDELASMVDSCLSEELRDMAMIAIEDAAIVSQHVGNVIAEAERYVEAGKPHNAEPLVKAISALNVAALERSGYLETRLSDRDLLNRDLVDVKAEIKKIDEKKRSKSSQERLQDAERRRQLAARAESIQIQISEINATVAARGPGQTRVKQWIFVQPAVMLWAQAQPVSVARQAWKVLEDARAVLGEGSADLRSLSVSLRSASGIVEGSDTFGRLKELEGQINIPDGADADDLRANPLSHGRTVGNSFWRDVTAVNYFIAGDAPGDLPKPLVDFSAVPVQQSTEEKRADVRQAAETFHDFVGDAEFGEKLSRVLHQGVIGPFLAEFGPGGSRPLNFEGRNVVLLGGDDNYNPGVVGDGGGLNIFLKKNRDGSIHVNVAYKGAPTRFASDNNQTDVRAFDPAFSLLEISFGADISKSGYLTLNSGSSYKYRLAAAIPDRNAPSAARQPNVTAAPTPVASTVSST
ncbi:hypothetical protein [Hyphomicrobium sp. MC1]|uniref:hypothetical protein n=1 Tax=Hyphomicrobium sp. (strain MC1) TaxID=717785 RepID=UPI000213EFE3|nr:hypothetical protein [Hyphomicrobium sp. MC1]CCB66688.1 protein of unknown function [Hyphomicrobium sp. MC1]